MDEVSRLDLNKAAAYISSIASISCLQAIFKANFKNFTVVGLGK